MSNPKSIRSSSYVYKRYIWLVSVLYANKRLSYAENCGKMGKQRFERQ